MFLTLTTKNGNKLIVNKTRIETIWEENGVAGMVLINASIYHNSIELMESFSEVEKMLNASQ